MTIINPIFDIIFEKSNFQATPVSDKGRQVEVEYYIRRNQVSKYIVIDDDPSLFCEPEKLKIFAPDYRVGLVKGDIK